MGPRVDRTSFSAISLTNARAHVDDTLAWWTLRPVAERLLAVEFVGGQTVALPYISLDENPET